MNRSVRFILFTLLLSSFFISCTKKKSIEFDTPVIATVGDKVITQRDLRARAELTVRPGNIRTPNAVLNNLIVEKLFSLEAGDTCQLENNPVFQAHIKGIKEQAMREQLYEKIAVSTVSVDTSEVLDTYKLSQRVYDLEFFTINDPDLTQKIQSRLEEKPESSTEIFDELRTSGVLGEQSVKWRDPEGDEIHTALFSGLLDVGEVVGPIKLSRNQSILMKVKDYKIEPVIGPEEQQMRWREVRAKLIDLQARSTWNQYKAGIMGGKRMDFDKDMFTKIVDWYLAANQNQDEAEISDKLSQEKESRNLKAPTELDDFLDHSFFKIDDEVWTVGDFKEAIASHPLVYPQKDVRPRQFPDLFREAVADLMVDHFLNQEAYKRDLEKNQEVQREGELWSDSFKARYHLESYLKKIKIGELQKQDPSYKGGRAIDEYVSVLKEKYKDQIRVDKETLAQIELTNVPLFAMRQGMPYPIVVPGFPPFLTADTLIFDQPLTF